MALTDRQKEVLGVVRLMHRGMGYGPSVRELSREMGFSSSNGAYYHMCVLEDAGCITRGNSGRIIIRVCKGVSCIGCC